VLKVEVGEKVSNLLIAALFSTINLILNII